MRRVIGSASVLLFALLATGCGERQHYLYSPGPGGWNPGPPVPPDWVPVPGPTEAGSGQYEAGPYEACVASRCRHDGGLPDSKPAGGDLASKAGCTVKAQGTELCLICVAGGKETTHECMPSSVTCKTVTTPVQVCVECTSSSGQVVEKKCLAIQQTCSAQVVQGKLCLVCQDVNGTILKTVCPSPGGPG